MKGLEAQEWIASMKKFYKDLNLKHSFSYGGQFYVMCEAFGLDPEEVKKEIEE